MELLQNKLKKTSRVYSVALLIFALYYVYAALSSINALVWLFSDPANALMRLGLPIAGIENPPLGWWKWLFFIQLLSLAVYAATQFAGFSAFRGIANTGEPFSPPIVRKLKIMVWLMVANIPLHAVCGYMAASVSPTLMGNSRITAISATASGVMDVLTFFALVSIFQYGARLQQLSDETL